jgi:hypothetical protein
MQERRLVMEETRDELGKMDLEIFTEARSRAESRMEEERLCSGRGKSKWPKGEQQGVGAVRTRRR